ncbi:hypothetical protein EDC01DRAFT_759899 [Geopyxis carbonaria]|nr:hypothetical protein EDC01DRAFT_759899 [Geopyxis carbonaria]
MAAQPHLFSSETVIPAPYLDPFQKLVDIYHERLMAQWRHLTDEEPPPPHDPPALPEDVTLDIMGDIITNFNNHIEAGYFPDAATKAQALTMILAAQRYLLDIQQDANDPLRFMYRTLDEEVEAGLQFYISVDVIEEMLRMEGSEELQPLWGPFAPKKTGTALGIFDSFIDGASITQRCEGHNEILDGTEALGAAAGRHQR